MEKSNPNSEFLNLRQGTMTASGVKVGGSIFLGGGVVTASPKVSEDPTPRADEPEVEVDPPASNQGAMDNGPKGYMQLYIYIIMYIA